MKTLNAYFWQDLAFTHAISCAKNDALEVVVHSNRKTSHSDGSPPRSENRANAELLIKTTMNDHRNKIATSKPVVKGLS